MPATRSVAARGQSLSSVRTRRFGCASPAGRDHFRPGAEASRSPGPTKLALGRVSDRVDHYRPVALRPPTHYVVMPGLGPGTHESPSHPLARAEEANLSDPF